MDQSRTPYFDVLLDYVDSGVIPFHTPGHMQGRGMDRAFRDFLGENVLAIDLTQIRGLDDLLQPEEAIEEAQCLAAEAYGSDHSFFLINGSTSGNQIMMMTALDPGARIAIPRNAHKSAMGGLIMSGATPVWMQPEVDQALHTDHTVTPQTVRATLDAHPDIKAVYVVSPTYYGVAADLESIAALAHERGIPLLVDEAWGPHFHFHPALPIDALEAGADLCINSTHKMLGSLSQTAMLHEQGGRLKLDRLKAVVKLFLSTSPNLVLIASLDVARRQMALEGRALLSQTIELANDTRARLNAIEGVSCFGEEQVGKPGVFAFDPTKITITVKALGYTGYEAEEILRRRYNVQCELADLFNCLALFTIGTTREAADRLVYGVKELAREDRPIDVFSPSGVLERRLQSGTYNLPDIPPIRMNPRDAFLAATESVRFKDSAGRICAEVITPYPPGIPVISPGEEITPAVVAYLDLEKKAGVRMQGPYDSELRTIRVVK
ncbi:MAG: aminotransferase class I/II-fold pyridoxal phosphate-dependent enzyme [Candidatus Eremiobacteraeota bacterium]|nr:aminotransferase class I/II-fold pyridoxal phosphate-dependent enzyme [Candidatus Eremiobacteraeota bacterium]MBC5822541.1 aminotransferase class I/II-fold pyridoxal phosphate-dependent enzyme [Candidatus Eremiobacteraeota bacterium]